MIENSRDEVTRLLRAIGGGEEGADEALMERLYAELRVIARSAMAGRGEETLQATGLVHEAYVRLLDRDASTWENRRNFFFAAARAMQDVLVEQARRKAALKRGEGWQRTDLDELTHAVKPLQLDMLALDEALAKLGQTDPRKLELVQLRFFSGLTTEEAADVLGVSARTVERDWRFVRAKLRLELEDQAE
jgi:RNA polymerase sigma factor (TIGR02999 family)